MKTIRYTFILIAVVFCSSIYAGQADSSKVDSIINAFMHRWDIPGGSFTMAFNRSIIYSKGYGVSDTASMTPVTTQNLFRIASCTKPFTAVAIMQLIQEGRINLIDTVFGPDGILNQPIYQNILDSNVLHITIENLLEHTGGWDDTDTTIQPDPMFYSIEIARWANIPSPPMQETIIKYVLSQMSLVHPPGTVYAYSNFGYCVLGRIIEKVTGLVYEDYIRNKILIPSGNTSMREGKSLLSGRFPNEVHYYGCPGEYAAQSVYDTNATAIVPWPYGGFNIEAMDSHGEWIASSQDLVKFLFAVNENRLISRNTYNIMTTPPSVNPGYAKGWAVNGPTIFHQGSLSGTVSEIVKASNGYMWALVFNKRNLSNQINIQIDNLGWDILPFLPPTLEDSCLISGPVSVLPSTTVAYHSGIQTNNWEIISYGGANAGIHSVVDHNVYVNTGSNIGSYTVYKIGEDKTVLCSLHVNIDATLPVEMETFSYNVNGNDVSLYWRTSSERNNFGFNVERYDIDSWKTLGFVKGNENSGSGNKYQYTDRYLSSGRYKYRIKQIDINGNYQYLEMSGEVFIGTPPKYFLSPNYPNPFNPVTKISFDIPVSNHVEIKIYDINGREVYTLVNEIKEAGYHNITVDASSFPSGVYFYRIVSSDFVMARKMILIK